MGLKVWFQLIWGSFLLAAASLKTPTRNGYNAQGVNFTFRVFFSQGRINDREHELSERMRRWLWKYTYSYSLSVCYNVYKHGLTVDF